VRNATALNFHYVCKTGGEHELFERLMPAFVRLSKDDMFRVRRACAESLSEISKYVSDDIRIGVLVEIFLRLAQDQYKVVKQSVLQQSGMFISTLPCQYVNENILSQFSCMANSPFGDAQLDLELKHYCAFSFPAVLLTVGSGRWKTVRPLYQALVKCNSPSVKQTLAASLHEIAKILGNSSLVEEELLPVFEQFIQVHITTLVVIFYSKFLVFLDVEDVQMGVMKHLAEFLRMLSVPCRLSFLPMLQDILNTTNPFNWRLRQSLALQLPELGRIYWRAGYSTTTRAQRTN
jgi:serine/threonine-protein phosphatase 4 regulatory subunit 1